ncbi:DnaB-like helicase N-terminal domain-containing protein [Solihabitans fulvus]|nr:DnaB-like helicase N-terminal domain-containing protein [Solihabitans fulvus]
MSPMTPREYAERALLGFLLLQPRHVTEIARTLEPGDFWRPAHTVVFRELRDMVAEATAAKAAPDRVWALYADEPAITVHHVQREQISSAQMEAAQDRAGQYLQIAEVDLPHGTPDAALADRVAEVVAKYQEYDPDRAYDQWMQQRELDADGGLTAAAVAALAANPELEITPWFVHDGQRFTAIRTGVDEFVIRHESEYDPREFGTKYTIEDGPEDDFDFYRDVIGDDIVYGGMVYSHTQYKIEDGEPVELTEWERDAIIAEDAAQWQAEQAARSQVPGVDPVSLHARVAASSAADAHLVTGPYLHTLVATAPSAEVAQPEAWALMVLEASLRRTVARNGMQVGQAADAVPELTSLLSTLHAALGQIEHVAQRWDRANPTTASWDRTLEEVSSHTVAPVNRDVVDTGLDLFADAPDERDIAIAENSVMAYMLTEPRVLDRWRDRLLPTDFADPTISAAYQTAVEMRGAGRPVEPVTIAWEQQRTAAGRQSAGLSVERLVELTTHPPVGTPDWAVDVVMRGAVARLTATAAKAVQTAAQHPGLQPTDLLHTARTYYQAVQSTVTGRMTSPPSRTDRLTGRDTTNAERAGGRTTAQVIDLRERSSSLRSVLSGAADTTGNTDLHRHAEAELDTDHGPDLGP